jgi:hypothetical protein
MIKITGGSLLRVRLTARSAFVLMGMFGGVLLWSLGASPPSVGLGCLLLGSFGAWLACQGQIEFREVLRTHRLAKFTLTSAIPCLFFGALGTSLGIVIANGAIFLSSAALLGYGVLSLGLVCMLVESAR